MNHVGGISFKRKHIDKTSIYSRPGKIYYCADLKDSYSLAV